MDLKIIVEQNIPFIRGVLEPYARVEYLAANQITAESISDADALITRTRTHCDSSLLDGSRCRFIATATIGTDHIDLPYCASRGITVVNAPGCNAPAVAQWVLASLLRMVGKPLDEVVLGVVGVGHVGTIVERWARGLGMNVLLCDPPRANKEGGEGFVSLDEVAMKADVITFHTPLTNDGAYPTFHLADGSFFAKCEQKPIVMNAARGSVIDTQALVSAIELGRVSGVAIDCWEGEPDVSPRLLEMAAVATPHVAGYSIEGKVRATQMSLDALSAHFGLPQMLAVSPAAPMPKNVVTAIEILNSYNPLIDTESLKCNPENFELLRNTYSLRREP